MDASYLRPMGIGEILDATIHITRSRFRDLAILVAVVAIPAQVLQFFVSLSVPESSGLGTGLNTTDFTTGTQSSPETDTVLLQFAAMVVTLVIGLVTSWLATAACAEVVSAAYLGGSSSWRDSLRVAWSRFAALVGANTAVLLISGAALFACIAPGVWLFISWSLVVPVILIERAGGIQAMRRSFRLVKGRWWVIFAIIALGQIIATLAQSVVVLPLIPLTFVGDLGIVGPLAAIGIGNVIGVVLTYPFLAALIVIVYYDLRIRKEGLDIALMMRDLDLPEHALAQTSGWADTPSGGFQLPPPSGSGREPPTDTAARPPGWDQGR